VSAGPRFRKEFWTRRRQPDDDVAIALALTAEGRPRSTIFRVNAPATIPCRNALELARTRIVFVDVLPDLVAALAQGDVRMGRNLSDRHARSDPTANGQKDKKGEQFPHSRLRLGWVG